MAISWNDAWQESDPTGLLYRGGGLPARRLPLSSYQEREQRERKRKPFESPEDSSEGRGGSLFSKTILYKKKV